MGCEQFSQTTPDRSRLVTRRKRCASDDMTARVWRLCDGSLVRTLVGHSDTVLSVAVSPDGMQLATASRDGTACVWRLADGAHLCTLVGHSRVVTAAAVGLGEAGAAHDMPRELIVPSALEPMLAPTSELAVGVASPG